MVVPPLVGCAYSPSHITGFFAIHDEPENPLLRGSTGVGVSLEKGVVTSVYLQPSDETHLEYVFNNQVFPLAKACIVKTVLEHYIGEEGGEHRVLVEQQASVPIGHGFGVSGAMALSLSLALNQALGTGYTHEKAAQIAHIAEIKCLTGLGTVLAEYYGGFGLRTRPGAPGYGEVQKLPFPRDHVVLCVTTGPIETKNILNSPATKRKVNNIYTDIVEDFMGDKSLASFLKLSRRFADETGFETVEVRMLLKFFDRIGVPATMLMFGCGVFTIAHREQLVEILRAVNTLERVKNCEVVVSRIAGRGACNL